jgi:hypothetical protein
MASRKPAIRAREAITTRTSSAGLLRRHREMLRILRSGQLIIDRKAAAAANARRGQRGSDTCDSHLRRCEHGLDTVLRRARRPAIATRAHAWIRTTRTAPSLRTVARRRRVDQHAQRRHAQDAAESCATVYATARDVIATR